MVYTSPEQPGGILYLFAPWELVINTTRWPIVSQLVDTHGIKTTWWSNDGSGTKQGLDTYLSVLGSRRDYQNENEHSVDIVII